MSSLDDRDVSVPGAPARRGENAGLPATLAALRAECELLSELVLGLPEDSFARPTRLPEWNAKELLAHVYRAVNRVNTLLDEPAGAAPDADSVSYWRMYDPVSDSREIADQAKEVASGYETGQQLAVAWDDMWRRAVGRAADTDPDRVVQTPWGPALTLDEYLRTRVLEATVHRADLNAAIGLPADPTDGALDITEEILLALLDPPPPGTAPISAIALIEAGTGRRELTAEEREALGDLADRFPLLQ